MFLGLSDKGQELPRVEKLVSQEQIKRYAQASGDFNPVHLDEEFAAAATFGRIVAHGMLILAFLSEMMTMAPFNSTPSLLLTLRSLRLCGESSSYS